MPVFVVFFVALLHGLIIDRPQWLYRGMFEEFYSFEMKITVLATLTLTGFNLSLRRIIDNYNWLLNKSQFCQIKGFFI